MTSASKAAKQRVSVRVECLRELTVARLDAFDRRSALELEQHIVVRSALHVAQLLLDAIADARDLGEVDGLRWRRRRRAERIAVSDPTSTRLARLKATRVAESTHESKRVGSTKRGVLEQLARGHRPVDAREKEPFVRLQCGAGEDDERIANQNELFRLVPQPLVDPAEIAYPANDLQNQRRDSNRRGMVEAGFVRSECCGGIPKLGERADALDDVSLLALARSRVAVDGRHEIDGTIAHVDRRHRRPVTRRHDRNRPGQVSEEATPENERHAERVRSQAHGVEIRLVQLKVFILRRLCLSTV